MIFKNEYNDIFSAMHSSECLSAELNSERVCTFKSYSSDSFILCKCGETPQ